MKTARKTFVTLFVTAFSVAFALLCTVLVAAACSEKVTLRFETGDGTYLASVEGASGGTYQKPRDPEKEGYFFDGWYADAGCSGESLTLPDVLPAASTTYYAKYVRCPVLTLEPEGGTLGVTEHRIRPGTDLLGYLSDYVPQKEGLLFGGWEKNGELLGEGAAMSEEDMCLKARYKAEYEVSVFLQSADEPQTFVRSDELSYTGADWLGASFTAKAPALAHFLYDAAGSVPSAALHEGENKFRLQFKREELRLNFYSCSPDGTVEEGEIESRYGAHIVLSDPACPEGYTFFGWTDGTEEYAGGGTLTLERSLGLNGSWGKLYPNVRGEGMLAVEVGEGDVLRADYLLGETRQTGRFFPQEGVFSVGNYRGKLARGGFLPDDSGRYIGSSLEKNATGEEYGVLTLDFSEGSAVYRTDGAEICGSYVYDYDETAKNYTGDYVFSASGVTFRFRLDEDTFLRQGKEKNTYAAYDAGSGGFLRDTLVLDGYGGGEWRQSETVLSGKYRGGKTAGEWEFTPTDGAPFRILIGRRVWSDGADFADEQAFLYYDAALDGTYHAPFGTLVLDGYGLNAVYRTEEGEMSGPFTRSGNRICVQAEIPLEFTLTESGFAPTGEECGLYAGEKGTLCLDGAGGALLTKGGMVLERGGYRESGGDWVFEGETDFRFRLEGETYLVFCEEIAGTYAGEWGLALELDGFGGAVYHDMFGGRSQLEVVYADENLLLLRGESMRTAYRTLSLAVDRAAFRVRENASMTAGIFPVRSEQASLVLDGAGGAMLLGAEKRCGTYEFAEAGNVACRFGDTPTLFRIGEQNGVYDCKRSDVIGVFASGEDKLTLDGYGAAVYTGGEGEIVSSYRMRGGAAEIERGEEVWRFVPDGGNFTLVKYTRYSAHGGSGELLLQKGGRNAILRTGEDDFGMYFEGRFVSDEREFEYRLYGREYREYNNALAVTYRVEGGGTLRLDGCGLGEYTVQNKVYGGEVTLTDVGLVVLSSEEIARSGMAGFRLGGNGTLKKLDEEFGLYTCEEDGELFLQGDGTAYYRKNGVWRVGSYERAAENEYEFDLYGTGFRFRTEGDGRSVRYSVRNEALAAYSGEYRTEEGMLIVDGYGISLGEEHYRFVCGCAGGLVAQKVGTQTYFAVHFGEITVLNVAESRYTA